MEYLLILLGILISGFAQVFWGVVGNFVFKHTDIRVENFILYSKSRRAKRAEEIRNTVGNSKIQANLYRKEVRYRLRAVFYLVYGMLTFAIILGAQSAGLMQDRYEKLFSAAMLFMSIIVLSLGFYCWARAIWFEGFLRQVERLEATPSADSVSQPHPVAKPPAK